jgi:septum formation topological specificity factor MinE
MGISLIDVGLYAGDWKLLKEFFLMSLEKWSDPDLRDWPLAFKQQVDALGIHYKWIRWSVEAIMLEGCGIGTVLQWLVFDEKLNLRSLDLTEAMVAEYRAFEDEMRDWKYDLPQVLYEVVDDWSTQFCLQIFPFTPMHGHGATAELPRRQATRGRKSQGLVCDRRILDYVKLRDVSNIDPLFFFPAGEVPEISRTARLQCVPKSMVKNRTISAEPTVLQYLQQDLFRVWDKYFQMRLSEHIDLHDQSLSRDLCLKASRTGDIASIDLSNASDSVTCALVSSLLGGTPMDDLLTGLMSTRSTHVSLPDGSVIPLLKYGGMGNGTTFPVETFVFSVLCESAARMATGTVDHRRIYRVYGDDILIDTDLVPALLNLLEQCHFTVNATKSYWSRNGHIFREACGMFACDGVDITPLRLSRRLYVDDWDTVTEAAGWVSLINDSLRYGYLTLRRVINALLSPTQWYRRLPRLSLSKEAQGRTSDSIYVLTLDGCDTQWCVKSRAAWNFHDRRGGYQVPQIRVMVARTRTLPESVPDEVLYFNWQLETLGRPEDGEHQYPDRSFSHSGPSVQRWTEAWVQKQ